MTTEADRVAMTTAGELVAMTTEGGGTSEGVGGMRHGEMEQTGGQPLNFH